MQKPRVIISTDIGGTDPDDNQSFCHLMMESDLFDLEGLVSSPSFGNGSKEEMLRMIDIYEKDFPELSAKFPELKTPDQLRSLCKQGQLGLADLRGYGNPTEGSEWIIQQARKNDDRPLWILGWSTLEDVAQALHDAPDIAKKIRVYWIGGPNKKWGVNSYSYVAANFPDLWMIENNATYRGFISDTTNNDKYNNGFYDYAIKNGGNLAEDFMNYYKGIVKMGDSPSVFYLMAGNPDNPESAHWGGSFVKIRNSARKIFKIKTDGAQLSESDTIPSYGVMEFHFIDEKIAKNDKNIDKTKPCFTMTISKQDWNGYYLGKGDFMVRYSPKAPGKLTYAVKSKIASLNGLKGSFTATRIWPGEKSKDDYRLGKNWYSDNPDEMLFRKDWQGVKTIIPHRPEILEQWKSRWDALKK